MKKKAILVVSFGTSYRQTREKTIQKIETVIQDTFKDYKVYRAYTSTLVINKIYNETSIKINTVKQAINEMINDNITDLIVQPTYMIHGIENNKMMSDIKYYADKFKTLRVGSPLLTDESDYLNLIKILKNQFSFISLDDHIVLMGHGSMHYKTSSYLYLDKIIKKCKIKNMHIATLDNNPSLDSVMSILKKSNAQKVHLIPLMIVCGSHASKDMTGNSKNSWENILKENGFEVNCIFKSLGEFSDIQKMFVDHIKNSSLLK